MDTTFIVWVFVGLVGMVVAVVLTAAAVFWLRKVTQSALLYLLEDEKLADIGAKFILFLVAFQGLEAVLRYITQDHLDYLLTSWLNLANNIIGVVQWSVQIAAFLFIGVALRKHKSEKAE